MWIGTGSARRSASQVPEMKYNSGVPHSRLLTLGFTGHPGVVLHWAKVRREKASRVSKPEVVSVPSGCSRTRLVMADPEALLKAEQSLVLHLLDQVPSPADMINVAKRLNALLRRKTSESLEAVLDAADRTPLNGFATSLRRDLDAIQAALDLPWTTSPVEGQVNRLKMLKRTMYGRAGFQLLRARVLHAA